MIDKFAKNILLLVKSVTMFINLQLKQDISIYGVKGEGLW